MRIRPYKEVSSLGAKALGDVSEGSHACVIMLFDQRSNFGNSQTTSEISTHTEIV